jgi:hypothetical protein
VDIGTSSSKTSKDMNMDAQITESFDLPSEGPHQAVIAEVLDAGFEKSQFPPHKLRAMMDVVFVLDERNDEDEPMRVTRRITKNVNRHTHLGRLLVAVKAPVDFKAKGTNFTGLDDALLGKRLQVVVQHSRRGESTFPDIVSFSVLPTRRAASLVEDVEAYDRD